MEKNEIKQLIKTKKNELKKLNEIFISKVGKESVVSIAGQMCKLENEIEELKKWL